jgi:hypothetical protein
LWGWDAAEEQVKSAIFIGHTGSSHLIIVQHQESCVSHERRISLPVFEGGRKAPEYLFFAQLVNVVNSGSGTLDIRATYHQFGLTTR